MAVQFFEHEVLGPSPNRTEGRPYGPVQFGVIHWWGAPTLYRGDRHDSVVDYLLAPRSPGSSANAVISGYPRRRVSEIVPETDIAWQAGNWEVNKVSVGWELQPFDDLTPVQQVIDTFETAAAWVAIVWRRLPQLAYVPLTIHSDHKATTCPGNWARLVPALLERARQLYPFVDPETPGLLREGFPTIPKELFMYSPIDNARVSSPYGPRGTSFHAGMDLAPLSRAVGVPIRAIYAGTVITTVATRVPGQTDRVNELAPFRTGNGVIVGNIGPGASGDGEGQLYGHITPAVRKGQQVRAGEVLGHIDMSGNTSGPHVHLEVWSDYTKPTTHRDPQIDFDSAGLVPGQGGGTGGGSSTPQNVLQAQQKLNVLQYGPLTEDNIQSAGGQTEQAIRAFQTDWGLVSDGVWGPLTNGKADAVLALRSAPGLRVDGDEGQLTTAALQWALAAASFYPGRIDGVRGNGTTTGEKRFLLAMSYDAGVPEAPGFDAQANRAEQTWLNRVSVLYYPWMPPDGVRGPGHVKGVQMCLNAGEFVVTVPPIVVPPEPEPEPEPPVEPEPEPPAEPTPPPATGTPILGPKGGSIDAYQARAREIGASALFVDEMLPALHDAAVIHGIDPAVLIGQSGHETGWGNFGRAVTPEHHNTCGLKIRNPVGPDDNPDDHARFASWFEGATAHAQHLYAYMMKPLPAGEPLVDPRWDWVFPVGHRVQTVEQLGGKWALSPTYGEAVAAVAARFRDLVEPPAPSPTPTPTPVPEPEPAPLPSGLSAEDVARVADAVIARLHTASWILKE